MAPAGAIIRGFDDPQEARARAPAAPWRIVAAYPLC
jgi:hypothetical protein